jgi:hypothetical protein
VGFGHRFCRRSVKEVFIFSSPSLYFSPLFSLETCLPLIQSPSSSPFLSCRRSCAFLPVFIFFRRSFLPLHRFPLPIQPQTQEKAEAVSTTNNHSQLSSVARESARRSSLLAACGEKEETMKDEPMQFVKRRAGEMGGESSLNELR